MGYYIRTRRATRWDEPAEWVPFAERVFSFVSSIFRYWAKPMDGPAPRPPWTNYGDMDLIDAWLIEFPDEDPTWPWREIGVGLDGEPMLAGPTEDDYGFWLDTNMRRWDFDQAEEIPESLFESLWARFFAEHPDLTPLD